MHTCAEQHEQQTTEKLPQQTQQHPKTKISKVGITILDTFTSSKNKLGENNKTVTSDLKQNPARK